jgi:hypothetical protein
VGAKKRINTMIIREIEIFFPADSDSVIHFAPVGCKRGEEVFQAPAWATVVEIYAMWAGYEMGKIPWEEMNSGECWDRFQ